MKKVKRARDYRHLAADKISGANLGGTMALVTLIYIILVGAAAFSLIGSIILPGAFMLGYALIVRKISNGDTPTLGDLFQGFNNFGQSIIIYFMSTLYIFLWSLLLIIPGIIKSYSYAMIYFIQNDNPKMAYNDVITESRNLMRGHKWRLFCLDLSYIGWYLLVGLTFGILGLWVIPRHQLAQYEFYRDLLGESEEVEVKVEVVDAEVVE
ncbi:MAG: DUF975 family protein [Erysipelotrichaceae bacterium]|nr:DUF975 family protein [Erysipelotrichaceae bacterium]